MHPLNSTEEKEVLISKKILAWLNKQAENELTFSVVRSAFLQGNVLKEGLAHVIKLKQSIPIPLLDVSFVSNKKNKSLSLIEILPHPTESELEVASCILKSMEIADFDFPISDLYFEDPKETKRRQMTFVLGE